MLARRRVLLVQLPIPPLGPAPIVGNVPLAAGYLKLFARRRGLESHYHIDILPAPLTNRLGEAALVEEILARSPWLVGFTCYVWNIERTLAITEQLRARQPAIRILLGGPEITRDNHWVLSHESLDYAAIGEGEQTFAELLAALQDGHEPPGSIAGLYRRRPQPGGLQVLGNEPDAMALPPVRAPLGDLNEISSPYLAGILDAADERMMLLETVRGCIFKCKFCYYPKSYDALYWVDEARIEANLRHARERGAKEVVLLDPTLNQRRNFDDFVRLLIRGNPQRQMTYFGELRAEGVTPQTGQLLREANFTEVEIGLQSIDPRAQELMDRKNSMKAFERGVLALRDAGIAVKIDLIVGLPGDTEETVRAGFDYLRRTGLYSSVQVFNLSILPGTAFRQEAASLGLAYQPRPPYYALGTPTLPLAAMYQLIHEAQDIFATEFDPFPEPRLDFSPDHPFAAAEAQADRTALCGSAAAVCRIDLEQRGDRLPEELLPPARRRAAAFTVWFTGKDWHRHAEFAVRTVSQLVRDNPHSSLQIVCEPVGDARSLSPEVLQALLAAAYRQSNYLDRFYSVHPSGLLGSKRLIVLLDSSRIVEESLAARAYEAPSGHADHTSHNDGWDAWLAEVEEVATIVWQCGERSTANGFVGV